MYQIIHGSAGLLIGSQLGNPWLAFILGVISHFVLDAIPHDAKEIREWQDRGNYTKKIALEAMVDLWFFLIIIYFLQINNLLNWNWSILAGIFGTLLPDYIWGAMELLKIDNKITNWYKNLHNGTHAILHRDIYISVKYTFLIQFFFLGLFWGVYFILKL